MIKVFVPRDAAALSVGADEVAAAIADEAKKQNKDRDRAQRLARHAVARAASSRSRRIRAASRTGQSPRATSRACSTPISSKAASHTLAHGLTDEIPYFKNQERLTFARCGITDPLSIDDYRAHGGFAGLTESADHGARRHRRRGHDVGPARPRRRRLPDRHQVEDGLGRSKADQKYVGCNADEGDSGTFADRMLMEGDPFCLIEGMTIAAIAGRCHEGLHLHPLRIPARGRTCCARRSRSRRKANWLGDNIQGSHYDFELFVRVGAGAYICGEETSMLDSLEGKRGDRPLQAAAPRDRRAVRQADRDQQRAEPRLGADHHRQGRRVTIATSASAGRAARSPSSSPATSSRAASSRRRSASPRAS